MIDTVLQKLIEFVETASPFLWETLYRQVYVQVVVHVIWMIIFIGLAAVCYKLFQYGKLEKAKDDDTEWIFGLVLGGIGATVFTVFSVIELEECIIRLINPNYYAIQLILSNIR